MSMYLGRTCRGQINKEGRIATCFSHRRQATVLVYSLGKFEFVPPDLVSCYATENALCIGIFSSIGCYA